MLGRGWWLPLLLAVLLTGANALKGPVVDDTAYLTLARHMAIAPRDPYGFDQFWYDAPEPAHRVLAPPVLPYWLSVGYRLMGERIWGLKLWLFPFALLLAHAFQSLLRRFAPGVEGPFLTLTMLSPAVLPAFNFMLDIPTLALATASVAVFVTAVDKPVPWLAGIAGLLAGLAAQTKYTGLVAVAVILSYAMINRRIGLGLAVALIAGNVFVAWEGFMAWKYGESHLLYQLRHTETKLLGKLALGATLPFLLGGVGIAPAFLGLAALRRRSYWIAIGALLVVGAYVVIAVVSEPGASAWVAEAKRPTFYVAGPVFSALGFGVIAVAAWCAAALVIRRLGPRHGRPLAALRLPRDVTFLLLFVALETTGYFAFSPFPASRRILGLVVAGTLVMAYLAARSCRSPAHRRILKWAVVPGVLLGVGYATLDVIDSEIEPRAIRAVEATVRAQDESGKIWYAGHWTFQFEAERRGWSPVIPRRSHLSRGDWLAVPDPWLPQQAIHVADDFVEKVETIEIWNSFPLRTWPAYYGGHLAVEPWPGPRLRVKLYRVREPWVPGPPLNPPPKLQ